MNSDFQVPKLLIDFIKNNNKEVVNEVISEFSSFWEVDRDTLNDIIGGNLLYGKIYGKNTRQ
jgi:hypothetical protein